LVKVYFFVSEYVQCDKSIFEKVFIWSLGQPVVWSEPNISQIKAWSYSIYASYQQFELKKICDFFLKGRRKARIDKPSGAASTTFFFMKETKKIYLKTLIQLPMAGLKI
jgi:hypothetical protein